MHRVTFRTSDHVTFQADADSTVTLLEAAERAGLTLRSGCRHGGCLKCLARLSDGEAAPPDQSALPPDQAAQGQVLLCGTRAKSDVTVDLPYDSSMVVVGELPTRQARIERLDRWPGDVVRLGVQLVEDDKLTKAILFEPGQYVEIVPPGGDQARAYSFASLPNPEGRAEFYIKTRPDGYFSSYLSQRAKVGDALALRGPLGEFTLRGLPVATNTTTTAAPPVTRSPRPRWLVCGGTGLAPIMSMARRLAQVGTKDPTVLIVGVDRSDQVFATEELAQLRASMPSLVTVQTVARPGAHWHGPAGTAVDQLAVQFERLTPDQPRPDLYLCGSIGFLGAARDLAASQGLPAEQIYHEAF